MHAHRARPMGAPEVPAPMRVPLGVLILALLAILAGTLELVKGAVFLGAIAFGPIPAGDGRVLIGSLAVIIGIAWIAVGAGAFSLKPWAWMVGVLVAILGLFEALGTLLLTLSWEYAVASAILPAAVVWYLNRAAIKGAFGVQDEIV